MAVTTEEWTPSVEWLFFCVASYCNLFLLQNVFPLAICVLFEVHVWEEDNIFPESFSIPVFLLYKQLNWQQIMPERLHKLAFERNLAGYRQQFIIQIRQKHFLVGPESRHETQQGCVYISSNRNSSLKLSLPLLLWRSRVKSNKVSETMYTMIGKHL